MGAKTWMLVYSKGNPKTILQSIPAMDRKATIALVNALFSSEKLLVLADGDLSRTSPPDDEIVAACFPGLTVLAAKEFSGDYPSKLPSTLIDALSEGTLYLHAMHSAVDWFAFAVWRDGKLHRSLSLSPDSGILENIGPRFPFEAPYWAGAHPAIDPEDDEDEYPFVFHPLELGEAALQEFFGYQLEGVCDDTQPEQIPLMRFQRNTSGWRFN